MTTILAFEQWKTQLSVDCQRLHKLLVFDRTGEYVLRLLWEHGIEPTVQGIVTQAQSVEKLDASRT